MDNSIPPLALSVRQPWAWAIVAGHKPIENRSEGSIRAGRMDLRRIAIHAASGMKEAEYKWAVWKLAEVGVTAPPPGQLPRRAIVGAATVTQIISQSDSPWFGGQRGLVLEDAVQLTPIPAPGALGYFEWSAGGAMAEAANWMQGYANVSGGLFDDLPIAFGAAPPKPFRTRK